MGLCHEIFKRCFVVWMHKDAIQIRKCLKESTFTCAYFACKFDVIFWKSLCLFDVRNYTCTGKGDLYVEVKWKVFGYKYTLGVL